MKCGACVRAVERTLLAQPGVQEASVNLVTRSAWLRLDSEATTASEPLLEQVLAALDGRGFSAKPRQSGLVSQDMELERNRGWWLQWRQLTVSYTHLTLPTIE